MAVFARAKRVTDPLDDRVKACLCGEDYRKTGYVISSGSEHEAEDGAFLSDLIHGFLESDSGTHAPDQADNSDGDGSLSDLDPTDNLKDILDPTAEDRFRTKLLSHVFKAADEFSSLRSNRPGFLRAVMASLRDSGFDAGTCKTRWEKSNDLVCGSYEFVDVIRSRKENSQRYLIEVAFAAEFEIARPTERYLRVVEALPRIYVGRPEDLKRVVRIVSKEMKRSLRRRYLHLPPWRKSRYMQAKWLGPYRRTIGHVSANSPESYRGERLVVNCRSVGFDPGDGSRVILPALAPTK